MISYYNNFDVLLLFGITSGLSGQFQPGVLQLCEKYWWRIALGGLAQTGIYFFYYRNLRHFEVWLVKLYLLLMPVVSCLIGVFFLSEQLTIGKIIGIIVVLAGAALILMRARFHPETR